jgi:hypothetical protein
LTFLATNHVPFEQSRELNIGREKTFRPGLFFNHSRQRVRSLTTVSDVAAEIEGIFFL